VSEGGDFIKPHLFLINGIAPIAEQKVANPMKAGSFFTNMVELLYPNGTTAFGCIICGDTTANRPTMSIHIGTHNPANAIRATKRKNKVKAERLTSDKAIGKVEQIIAELEAERDHYKAIARKYAKQLNTLREVFAVDKDLL
jgi:hypothetical protein